MSYVKHNFKSGDKLYASQLNEMDEGITNAATVEYVDRSFIKSYIKTAEKTIQVSKGQEILTNVKLFQLNLKQNTEYKLTISFGPNITLINQVLESYIDETLNRLLYVPQNNKEYTFTTAQDITGIRIYLSANNVTDNDEITIKVSYPVVENILDNINNIEKTYNNLDELLMDGDTEIGKYYSIKGYYKPYDGGAGIYKLEEVDNYGIKTSKGYMNLIGFNKISPKAFGAIGDGMTNDSVAFQQCLDFCANKYIIDISDGCYLIADLNLYHNNSYDIQGCLSSKPVAPTSKDNGTIMIDNRFSKTQAGFNGDISKGKDSRTGLPAVTLNLFNLKIGGYQKDLIFPTCFNNISFIYTNINNIRCQNVSTFIRGTFTDFSFLHDCNIQVTDAVLEGLVRVQDDAFFPQLSDSKFDSNIFFGIHKWGSKIYRPVVFYCTSLAMNQFTNNFCGAMNSIIKCSVSYPNDNPNMSEILFWRSSNNIYSYCISFVECDDDILTTVILNSSKMENDEVWYCSHKTLVEGEEGQRYYNDIDGTSIIKDEITHFFKNITILRDFEISDIRLRYCDKLFPDEMCFQSAVKITNGWVFKENKLYPDHKLSNFELDNLLHTFDAKIPKSDFDYELYKYNYIESWNNRIVDTLPVIQDENYRYVLEKQTCIYNHKLLTCYGDNWYDTNGNIVTQ